MKKGRNRPADREQKMPPREQRIQKKAGKVMGRFGWWPATRGETIKRDSGLLVRTVPVQYRTCTVHSTVRTVLTVKVNVVLGT